MQLLNIDRNVVRPAGAEVVAAVAPRVIPVAPVNPPVSAPQGAGANNVSASVVNEINPEVQAKAQREAKSDPLEGGAKGDDSIKGWTQRKEETVKKTEEVPKEPVSKLLMDHLRTVWGASARVVEIWMQNNPTQNPLANQQVQAQTQADKRHVDPMATPGLIAKETLTYSPTKIKRPEKAE